VDLRISDPQDIHLMIGGAAVLFRGENWSAPFPDIEIFDAKYVSENIFASDVVEYRAPPRSLQCHRRRTGRESGRAR